MLFFFFLKHEQIILAPLLVPEPFLGSPESFAGNDILFWHTGGQFGVFDKVPTVPPDPLFLVCKFAIPLLDECFLPYPNRFDLQESEFARLFDDKSDIRKIDFH
jgi:hypothetical protein